MRLVILRLTSRPRDFSVKCRRTPGIRQWAGLTPDIQYVDDARPNDSFGPGFYDVTTGNASAPEFFGLGDEWGVEAFYNIAITPWAQFTPGQPVHRRRPQSLRPGRRDR